jgi:hypothetical protein
MSSRFLSDFLSSSPGSRVALVQRVVSQNQHNSNIINLLANVDYNYKEGKDNSAKNRPDNIFFICRMLNAFPDFRY